MSAPEPTVRSLPESVPFVSLGGHDYAVRPKPLRVLQQLQGIITELVRDLAITEVNDLDAFIGAVVTAAMGAPERILAVFLDDLQSAHVLDATVPELIDASGVIAQVNRLDVLGKARSLLGLLQMAAQLASQSSGSSAARPTASARRKRKG